VKPLKFDRSKYWKVFHWQFEIVVIHSGWSAHEKVTHPLSILQGQTADIIHGIWPEDTYEDIIGALKGHYGHYHLVAAYWWQKSQDAAEGRVTAAVEQLVNQVLVRLPERSVTEALNQALKLDCEGGKFL
jgi:hypothetical protein